MTDDIWNGERSLWTGGIDAYAASMAPGAVMAFADPVGIVAGDAVLDAVRAAPRWDEVEMTDRHEVRRDPTVVVAYRASAHRGGEDYAAICASTWIAAEGGWRLVGHQQIPAGSGC